MHMKTIKNFFQSDRFLDRKKNELQEVQDKGIEITNPDDVLSAGIDFYKMDDLIYFPTFNAYGAFKYDVVKDILTKSSDISVSDVHISLNDIYFQLDERK